MPAGKGKGKSRGGSSATTRGRSRSRNTTPASATDFTSLSDSNNGNDSSGVPTYDEVFQALTVGGSDANQAIPSSNTLAQLHKDILSLCNAAKARIAICDDQLTDWRKRLEDIQADEKDKADKEEKEKGEEKEKSEKKDRDKLRVKEEKDRKKKERTASDSSTSRPHALGAHQTTNQAPANAVIKEEPVDGKPVNKKRKAAASSQDDDEDDDELSPAPKSPKVEDTAMEDEEEQPAPAPQVIIYEELVDDPSAYEIGTVTPETTVEEKKKIFSVANYPQIDITDLLPGDAPDEDFSRAKPTNQVAMNSFLTYIEPYFRPFTEEDLAFLRERSDRLNPYIIPPLGRHYIEVWAEEDGNPAPSTSIVKAQENVAIGKPDDMDEATLDKVNGVSLGPLLTRVLTGMVSGDHEEEQVNLAITNGDVDMGNSSGTNGVVTNGITNGPENNVDGNSSQLAISQSAATLPLPESIIVPKDWKLSTNRPDFAAVEERIRQEMIHMGMVGPSDTFRFQERVDDEVSARLRLLQHEFRQVAIRNGARKARLSELLKEQLAYQEYSTILDDLDKQVDQAYLKRTRGMKAKKKRAGPNGHSSSGAAKPGIGDVARTLMERKKKWRDTIGPVFDKGLTGIPKETIFDSAIMARLEQKETLGEVEED